MKLYKDDAIENNIHYFIDFTKYGEVTVLAQNLENKKIKLAYYYADYNFRDGYKLDDIIEIYRILDEFIEELKNEKRDSNT